MLKDINIFMNLDLAAYFVWHFLEFLGKWQENWQKEIWFRSKIFRIHIMSLEENIYVLKYERGELKYLIDQDTVEL